MHLLGTIFSSGFIHNWFCSEYLSEDKLLCVFMCVMKAHVTQLKQCGSLMCFSSFWTKWSSLAQMKKIYQAFIHIQYLVDKFTVGLGLYMRFVDSDTNIEYNQAFPFQSVICAQRI